MRNFSMALLFPLVLACVAIALPVTDARGQATGCASVGDYTPVDIGSPNAEGTTLPASLRSPGEKIGVQFTVKQVNAASLYVGDQWYDLDLYLYARGLCPSGRWSELIRAWSTRSERRLLQFMRPDEQIVNLTPGNYLLLAEAKEVDSFDPGRGFTVRVALNSPYCALDPPDQLVPNPSMPSITLARRPDDALYQLGLLVDPPEVEERGPFALLTFTAFVSPPYIDLFDFAWHVDGRAVPDVTIGTLQMPASDLARTEGGAHTVRVTAIGAREYPDPALTHIPPTLMVTCPFRVPTGNAAGGAGTSTAPGAGAPAPSPGGTAPGIGPAEVPPTPTPPSPAGTGSSAPAPPASPPTLPLAEPAPSYEPDFTLLQGCRDRVGVVGAYSSSQQFDQVVACYVQETVAAGSPLSPAEIERRIRLALAM